jgi:hypothetical protein
MSTRCEGVRNGVLPEANVKLSLLRHTYCHPCAGLALGLGLGLPARQCSAVSAARDGSTDAAAWRWLLAGRQGLPDLGQGLHGKAAGNLAHATARASVSALLRPACVSSTGWIR